MFGAAAACRDKHRLQPGEPKPRPAEARKYSPRGLRHENNTAPTEAELANLQRTLFLNKANAACGSEPGDSRSSELPHRKAAARATLRIAKPQNEKNRRKKTARQNKQFLKPTAPLRRQRTAESTTSLTRAVTPVTPGRLPLPGTKKGGRPNLPPFSLCGAMITECPARPSTWPPS